MQETATSTDTLPGKISSQPTSPISKQGTALNRSFVCSNIADVVRELRIRTLLLRASIAIESELLAMAEALIREALEVARKLDDPAIEAKCRYWEARLRHSQGRDEEAAQAFLRAKPCVGIHIEGEHIGLWLRYYAEMVRNMSPNTPATERPARDSGVLGEMLAPFGQCPSMSQAGLHTSLSVLSPPTMFSPLFHRRTSVNRTSAGQNWEMASDMAPNSDIPWMSTESQDSSIRYSPETLILSPNLTEDNESEDTG
jgi:hypothetical protein